MQIGGYDFPTTTLELPKGAARWPSIYTPYIFNERARPSYSLSFDKTLLPAELREDLYRFDVSDYARVKSGSAPLVECEDMAWLIQRIEEARVSNRPSDWIFTQHALRVAVVAAPMRWIATKSWALTNEADDRTTTLLFDTLEIIKH